MRQVTREVVAFFDWKLFTALAACLVVALLIAQALVVLSVGETQRDSRGAFTRRINTMTGKIDGLTEKAEANATELGKLQEQVAVLIGQLESEGITPAVRPGATARSENRPTDSPESPANDRPPTTTPEKSPPTTQPPRQDDSVLCVLPLIPC